MKVKDKTVRKVSLILDEEEAIWLFEVTKDPFRTITVDLENEDSRAKRCNLNSILCSVIGTW